MFSLLEIHSPPKYIANSANIAEMISEERKIVAQESEPYTELFEGDIIPSWRSISVLYGEDVAMELGLLPPSIPLEESEDARLGLTAYDELLWPYRDIDGKAYVPYEFGIGSGGAYSNFEKQTISSAFQELSDMVGVIDFVFRTNEPNYVVVKNEGGCASYIGVQYIGPQLLDVGWCRFQNNKGNIMHEMMHTLGLHHEQSRSDRDEYITINEDNIISFGLGNFEKVNEINSLESPYDYCSIMHYGPFAYAINLANPTIEVKPGQAGCEDFDGPIGQRERPSSTDITQLRQLYQCTSGPRGLSNFFEYQCTSSCKCWEGAFGCGSDEDCLGGYYCVNSVCSSSLAPTKAPSTIPTKKPSLLPSYKPTIISSGMPSSFPTNSRSHPPSFYPSVYPSLTMSQNPSISVYPTISKVPSLPPTISMVPSLTPSSTPTSLPSISSVPSILPSYLPSLLPTEICTEALLNASFMLSNIDSELIQDYFPKLDNIINISSTAIMEYAPEKSELKSLQVVIPDDNERKDNLLYEFQVGALIPCKGICHGMIIAPFYQEFSENFNTAIADGSLETYLKELAGELGMSIFQNIFIEPDSFSMTLLIDLPSTEPSFAPTNQATFFMCRNSIADNVYHLFESLRDFWGFGLAK